MDLTWSVLSVRVTYCRLRVRTGSLAVDGHWQAMFTAKLNLLFRHLLSLPLGQLFHSIDHDSLQHTPKQSSITPLSSVWPRSIVQALNGFTWGLPPIVVSSSQQPLGDTRARRWCAVFFLWLLSSNALFPRPSLGSETSCRGSVRIWHAAGPSGLQLVCVFGSGMQSHVR